MEIAEVSWDFREGRDDAGDKYSVHILIHASGRILAKVHEINYYFRGQFYFKAPKEVLDTDDAYDFMDVISCQRFCEQMVLMANPLAKVPATIPQATKETVTP